MSVITRAWWQWVHSRKFAKVGKHCNFAGKNIVVDGNVQLGDHVRLRDNTVFRTRESGKITIGDGTIISWGVIIESGELVQIGPRSGIAEYSVIRDGTHLIYGTKENARYTPYIIKPVIIGEGVWIGSGAYISHGVTIGDGAVVGAGSVVLKDIPPFEVWAGAPAKFVAHRTENVPPHKLAEAQALIAEHGMREDRREL